MGLNHSLVGKQYPAQEYGVTAEAAIKYARAYNEDNPVFTDTARPDGILAPPMFGVVIGWLPIMTVMTDSELNVDLLRLLHGEHDMVFHQTIRPGDILTSTATILQIEDKGNGESLVLEVQSANQKGEAVQKMLFTAFIREQSRGGGRGRRSETFGVTPPEEPLVRVHQRMETDQTYRYAEASGDYNPIHIDENVAKMAGLPGIIVHGLCTMAFTSKVMLDQLCGRDPRRLKRLRVRFSRPVFPGQEITTAVWKQSEQGRLRVYTYETYNPDGKAVIKDGRAEIRV